MMGILGYLTGLILCIAIPPMIIAGACSFCQMDIGLMNPANWHQSARVATIIWAAVVVFTVIIEHSDAEHENYYYD